MTAVFNKIISIRLNQDTYVKIRRCIDNDPEKYPKTNGDYNYSLYTRIAILRQIEEDGKRKGKIC